MPKSFSRNTRRSLVALLSMLCLACASPMVANALPAGGTRYHSAASADGELVALAFSRDGRRVKHAFLSYAMKCSDGKRFTQSFTLDDIRVGQNGSFKAVLDTGPVANETGSETDHVQLSLAGRRTRTRVTGTSRLRFEHVVNATGTRVTCDSGLMRYVAND